MIKKFNEYSINESMNGFNKGDVVEVISIFGQTEDLNAKQEKYIGRIYIVDSSDEHRVDVLDGGTWATQDVRKLSSEEIKKRQPEIQEIISTWDKKKVQYKERAIGRIKQSVKNIHAELDYVDEEIQIIEMLKNTKGDNYKATLKIEKLG